VRAERERNRIVLRDASGQVGPDLTLRGAVDLLRTLQAAIAQLVYAQPNVKEGSDV
jgi:hypothetical protein